MHDGLVPYVRRRHGQQFLHEAIVLLFILIELCLNIFYYFSLKFLRKCFFN